MDICIVYQDGDGTQTGVTEKNTTIMKNANAKSAANGVTDTPLNVGERSMLKILLGLAKLPIFCFLVLKERRARNILWEHITHPGRWTIGEIISVVAIPLHIIIACSLFLPKTPKEESIERNYVETRLSNEDGYYCIARRDQVSPCFLTTKPTKESNTERTFVSYGNSSHCLRYTSDGTITSTDAACNGSTHTESNNQTPYYTTSTTTSGSVITLTSGTNSITYGTYSGTPIWISKPDSNVTYTLPNTIPIGTATTISIGTGSTWTTSGQIPLATTAATIGQ